MSTMSFEQISEALDEAREELEATEEAFAQARSAVRDAQARVDRLIRQQERAVADMERGS